MKIPSDSVLREGFYWELIQKCLVSRNDRKSMYDRLRSYALFGTDTGQEPAAFNKIDSAIDTLASFLFAADTTRFSIKLGAGVDKKSEMPKIPPLVERLTDRWYDSNCDIVFLRAIKASLTYASSHIKLTQRSKETFPYLVHPSDFGVLREDVTMLDRQEAMVHVFMSTKDQLRRDLERHPNKDVILMRLSAMRRGSEQGELPAGVARIITSSFYPTSQGNVNNVLSGSSDWYRPTTSEELVEMHELWLWDDDCMEGKGGYRVVTMADPGIVIYDRSAGESMFLVGDHPFIQVCPNPAEDYFWGISEVAKLTRLQDKREHHMAQIDDLVDRAVSPPKSISGQWGAVDEKDFAMRRINAVISSNDPMAKINEHKPQLPPDLWQCVRQIDAEFDEVTALSNVLKGRGEAGVRSKGQTDALVRTGSSRTKQRALIIEEPLERIATLYVKLDQRHNKDSLETDEAQPRTFIAEQFTKNFTVKVDAHSSSPIFVEDQKNDAAFMLQN
ncbi:MAG: hypothetical protein WCH79_20765, partial [Planctomycetia bacterium]